MNDADLKLKVDTLSSQQQNLHGLIQALHIEFPKIKADIAKYVGLLESHKEAVRLAIEDFVKLKSLVATIREEFVRNLTTAHKSLLDVIEVKFKAVVHLIDDQEEIRANVTALMAKIEEISIDAQNAVLKAGNNDIQVQLHRKKLDNIRLMLENQELRK